MIQDYILSITQVVLTLAVVPMLRKAAPRPALSVSLLTSACLYVMAGTMLSMQLYSTAAALAIGAVLWLGVVYRTVESNRSNN